MVSLLHEGVIKLVRDCPSFAADLLGQVLRIDVPGLREATPDPATATWAARPVELGGGVRYWPLVIGPDGIPKITDRDRARREPQLTVLSVLAHGQADVETATAIGGAAAWAILPFPEEQRLLYSLLIEAN